MDRFLTKQPQWEHYLSPQSPLAAHYDDLKNLKPFICTLAQEAHNKWAGEESITKPLDILLAQIQVNHEEFAQRQSSKPRIVKRRLVLSARDVACLLAWSIVNGQEGLPLRPCDGDWPFSHFSILTTKHTIVGKGSAAGSKALCVLSYFACLKRNPILLDDSRVIVLERRAIDPDMMQSQHLVLRQTPSANVMLQEGVIGNAGPTLVEADFANAYLGGGVLNRGAVQEEILFVKRPELIVSTLLAERLQDNETLVIAGALQFNETTGYASSFRWAMPCRSALSLSQSIPDKVYLEGSGTYIHRHCTVAMDALRMIGMGMTTVAQLQPELFYREVIKAACAFEQFDLKDHQGENIFWGVSTGLWGCGAFGCDIYVKYVQQWIAASIMQCQPLEFVVFEGDKRKGTILSAIQRFQGVLSRFGVQLSALDIMQAIENVLEGVQAKSALSTSMDHVREDGHAELLKRLLQSLRPD